MKNSDILYPLSTDYDRLEKLLIEGKKIIGFVDVEHQELIDDHCYVSIFSYNQRQQSFDLGGVIFWREQMSSIEKFCKRLNVRFIDIND